MAIRQITIIGTGLIGGSFGLALKKHRFRGRIVGCDREPVLKRAQKLGVIDEGESNPLKAVSGSQIVLLAKHFAHDHWQSLTVPRNRSAEFNQKVAMGKASQR